MRNNQKIMRFLFVLVIGIWGTITYQVFATFSSKESDHSKNMTYPCINGPRKSERYAYVKDVRDPFEYTKPVRKDTARKRADARPRAVWSPPPFTLAGIVTADKNKTAMLAGTDGSVFFLREKDTLGGMKILKITQQGVQYYFKKKKGEWVFDKAL
jgi:hypothetical protein